LTAAEWVASYEIETFGLIRIFVPSRSPSVSIPPRDQNTASKTPIVYSTLQRSVGTEFKVMQELLRHSSLRSTLDVYTQAITPAKHAAQPAVMSLVLGAGRNPGD
jgi:hypothetical protein